MDGLLRALAFIEANVEAPLDGAHLARVARLSRFHFHRAFARTFGLGARGYVEQVRLRRAAYRLAFRPDRILDIALDSGFSSHEAFGRAFKRAVGQTPAEFRRAPAWNGWAERTRPLAEIRARHQPTTPRTTEVHVVERPPTPIVCLRHRPDDGPLLAAALRFVGFRRAVGLHPATHATFNLIHRDGTFTFAVATTRAVALEPDMFVEVLPGGRCAVLRHVGDEEALRKAARWLGGDWLEGSGHAARGEALVLHRLAFFPDVAERDAVTDVVLPIE